MPDYGDINVKITATAEKADRSINVLVGKLKNLQTALDSLKSDSLDRLNNSINGMGNFTEYANGIREVKNAMQSLARVNVDKFKDVLKSLQGMAHVNLSNLEALKDIDFSGLAKFDSFLEVQRSANEAAEAVRESMTTIEESAEGARSTLEEVSKDIQDAMDSIGDVKPNTDGVTSKTEEIKSEMRSLSSGVGGYIRMFVGNAITGLVMAIQTAMPYIKKFSAQLAKIGLAVGGKVLTSLGRLTSSVAKLSSGFALVNSKHGIFSKGLSGGFMTVMRYAFGIRSLFVLFNKLRNVITSGMGNLAKQNASVNTSVSMLLSTLNQLKGNVVSVFAPALQAIAAPLSSLIQMFADGAAKVAAFISALTGRNMMIKATASAADYAASLDKSSGGAGKGMGKAAKNAEDLKDTLATMSFDELNQLQDTMDKDNNGGSGGGGGGGAGDVLSEITYEESEIPKAIKAYADLLKESWEDADFTKIGDIVGDKINSALNRINWESIETTSKKVGRSLATLLNGMLGSELNGETFGTSIGESFVGVVNTAIEGIEAFNKDFRFDTLGGFVGDAINSVLTGIHYDTFSTSCKELGKGIAEAINNFATPKTLGNFGASVGKLVSSAISGASSFAKNADWKSYGQAIAKGINKFFDYFDFKEAGLTFKNVALGLLNTLRSAIEDVNWKNIGYKIRAMLKEIPWTEILSVAGKVVADAFVGAIDFAKALTDNTKYGASINSLQQINTDIGEALEELKKWKDDVPDYSFLSILADEYFSLAEKVDSLSDADYNNMVLIADQLVTAIPDLKQYYDAETGMLNTTRQEIDKYIDSLKKKAVQEAAQEALKEYVQAQLDAKEAMESAEKVVVGLEEEEKHLKEQQKMLNDAIENGEDSTGTYAMQLDQLGADIAKNKEQQEEANKELKKSAKYYSEAKTKVKNFGKEMAEVEKEILGSSNYTVDFVQNLKKIPNSIKVKIEKGNELSFDEKVSVVAEVTGIDQSKLTGNKKKIEGAYAEIVKAIQQDGYTPNIDVKGLIKEADDKLTEKQKTLPDFKAIFKEWSKGKNFSTDVGGMKAIFKEWTKGNSFTNAIGNMIANIVDKKDNIPVTKKIIDGFKAGIGSFFSQGKALGGVFSKGMWKDIPQFASGGSPTHGTVFLAGESGAEIVGKVNGRTEVLNASQIASAIYSAVRSAMIGVIGSFIQPTMNRYNELFVGGVNSINANLGMLKSSILTSKPNINASDFFTGFDISKKISDGMRIALDVFDVGFTINDIKNAVTSGMIQAIALQSGNERNRPINLYAELMTPDKEVMGRYVMEGINLTNSRENPTPAY